MNRLNLVHNIDIADLMKTVDACKGDVFLETDEGDVLNLKSKFCQIRSADHPIVPVNKNKMIINKLRFCISD